MNCSILSQGFRSPRPPHLWIVLRWGNAPFSRQAACAQHYTASMCRLRHLADTTSACVLQAPLFGMLSWVNSSEVRRWLQTKIADPQTLRSSSAQDNAFANPLSRHNSDVQLAGGQDGMPGLPTPSHHSDNSWVSHSMPFNTSHRSRNPVHALSHTFASAACAP